MSNFMERAITGEFSDIHRAIDDAIDEWHLSSEKNVLLLSEWLGMSYDEYATVALFPAKLKDIINERKKRM